MRFSENYKYEPSCCQKSKVKLNIKLKLRKSKVCGHKHQIYNSESINFPSLKAACFFLEKEKNTIQYQERA